MQPVSDKTWQALVQNSTTPVLVKATAKWCAPCRAMNPGLLAAETELSKLNVKVLEIDIDESPAVTMRMGLQAVPTLVLFRLGRELGRNTGAIGRDWIMHYVRQWMGL